MATYNSKTVSEVVLAPESVQNGATGDNRIVMIGFTDGSLPTNRSIAQLKRESTSYANQIITATAKKADADSVVDLTISI